MKSIFSRYRNRCFVASLRDPCDIHSVFVRRAMKKILLVFIPLVVVICALSQCAPGNMTAGHCYVLKSSNVPAPSFVTDPDTWVGMTWEGISGWWKNGNFYVRDTTQECNAKPSWATKLKAAPHEIVIAGFATVLLLAGAFLFVRRGRLV